MPDRTVNSITDAAWYLNGIKSPVSTDDTFAMERLQDMLSSWSDKGIVVPYYVTENFTLTIGQSVYTIGVTGDSPDLVTATGRPIRVVSAFIRQSNNDYPIDVDMTEAEYNFITTKSTQTRPVRLYYDPQYPTGKIRFSSQADLAYDFHLVSEKPFTAVTALTDTFSIPLSMNEAMVYNLAIRIAPIKNNKLTDDIRRLAQSSLDIVEQMNSVDKLQKPNRLDIGITYGVQR